MRRKKNTIALVVTIIELIAILGMYLTIGLTLGLEIAREAGWIEPKKQAAEDTYLSDEQLQDWLEENSDVWEYEYPAEDSPSEDVTMTPEPEEVFYCPHCGAVLWDEYAAYCDECGLDPNAPAPTPEPELFAEQVSASELQSRVMESGYGQIYAESTWESSIVDQKGTHNNSASALVDGDLETSWQEGVSGDGLGESVMLDFGREVEITGIEMYLGNHRTDEWFYKNNVPEQVTVLCYGASDGSYEEIIVYKESHQRGATCVSLNRPVYAQYVEIVINSVYKGSKYDDTCIAEIMVYGDYR